MIFKVDLENKSIVVEDTVPIDKFIENLEKLVPKEEWKDWSIGLSNIIYWYPTYPIINPYVPAYPIEQYEISIVESFNGGAVMVDANPMVAAPNVNESSIITVTANNPISSNKSFTFIEFKDE